MSELVITNYEGALVTDSRDVATMVDKNHKHLLRDIKGYNQIISTSPKLDPLDFFIPGTYEDSKGEKRPYYLLTKKGCDMVANKMTGQKGVLFTAAYVTKFHEMEKHIQNNVMTKHLEETTMQIVNNTIEVMDAKYQMQLKQLEDKCSQYFRPTAKTKHDVTSYIKKRLGIEKANEEYDLVKERVLLKLNANKWEDIPVDVLVKALNVIDESIKVIKADRVDNQITFF